MSSFTTLCQQLKNGRSFPRSSINLIRQSYISGIFSPNNETGNNFINTKQEALNEINLDESETTCSPSFPIVNKRLSFNVNSKELLNGIPEFSLE
jgi:hypothetical protein